MKTKFDVYNLEFPAYRNELRISGYRFKRVPDYKSALKGLSHRITSTHEYTIAHNTGSHQITASVIEDVAAPRPSVLDWPKYRGASTHLDDVLLILSLFTGREVFSRSHSSELPILNDSRQHIAGGELRASIPYKASKSSDLERKYDAGFELTLNSVCKRVAASDWQQQYRRGHFLFLAHQIFRSDNVEVAFTGAWTLWEHLFSLFNSHWMSEQTIRHTHSMEKISFILTKFGIQESLNEGQKKILSSSLASVRNELVHYGRLPDTVGTLTDPALFIHLTEMIVSKSLGVEPKNVFNSLEGLEQLLEPKPKNDKSRSKKLKDNLRASAV